MDERLLGKAVEYHGPDFLRQLQLEQEKVPANIFLHLQNHRPQVPEINDPTFIMNMRRFVSKKADILFKPFEMLEMKSLDPTEDEDSYAKMPPIETFMGLDKQSARTHFYYSIASGDFVIGVVTSIVDSGLLLQLLCCDGSRNRDIDDLNISCFVPCKEIPKMFPTQNPVEGYQVKDFIRGVVVNVNPENENVLISLIDRGKTEGKESALTLGLIHEEDFPVQYRRKLHIRGLTFDELVNSILGFANPGNVSYLLTSLRQTHESSLMRGLHRLEIPEKEYAENLKKQQSQKWAYQCVAEGVAFFKEGKETEAMQKLNKALQIDTGNVEALVARGALFANTESYSKALQDFEEALKLNSKHPNAIKYMHETLLAKGKLHEDEKDYGQAKDCYQRALDMMPDSQEAKESLRYVQYKEDKAQGKFNKEDRKEDRKKERTPSPVYKEDPDPSLPFKETTDTLKKLIRDEHRSRKRQTAYDRLPEEEKIDQKTRKRRSRSSSSSGSRSGSRSRSKVKSKGHRDEYNKDAKTSRDEYSKDSKTSTRKSRSRSPKYELGKERDASEYFDYSLKKVRRSGFRESPTRNMLPEKDIERSSYQRSSEKKEFNPSKGYHADRERYMEKGHKKSESPERKSSRKGSQSPRDLAGGLNPVRVKRESRRSETPTKDEFADRLGLEDISPEDHNARNEDYKLMLYRKREEDYKFREAQKRRESGEYLDKERSGRDRVGAGRGEQFSSERGMAKNSSADGDRQESRGAYESRSYDPAREERYSGGENSRRFREKDEAEYGERRIVSIDKRNKADGEDRKYESQDRYVAANEQRSSRDNRHCYETDSPSLEKRGIVLGKNSSTKDSKSPRDTGDRSMQKNYAYPRSRSRSPAQDGKSPVRVIKMKPKGQETPQGNKGQDQVTTQGSKGQDDEVKPKDDIFRESGEPADDADKVKNQFATYVPRSVKLKHNPEKSQNPERLQSGDQMDHDEGKGQMISIENVAHFERHPSKDDSERSLESRTVKMKPLSGLNVDNDPRFKFHAITPDQKRPSSRQSSSHEGSRNGKAKYDPFRRSKSRSGSSESSRSRSRSHKKIRSRSRSSSSAESRSGRRRKRSRSDSREAYSKRSRSESRSPYGKSKGPGGKKLEPVVVPEIVSRWDSPKEKKSRWEGMGFNPEKFKKVDSKVDTVAGQLFPVISSSPPPHRSMKPEEKKKLDEKWKELKPVKIDPEETKEQDLQDIVKQRAAEVAAKINTKFIPLPSSSDPDRELKEKVAMAQKKINQLIQPEKEERKKFKWESDSESGVDEKKRKSVVNKREDSAARRKSRSSSSESSRRSKRRSGSDSDSRSRSRDRRSKSGSGSRSKSRSRSKTRSRSRERRYKSRSRSRDRRNRSRSRSRSRSHEGRSSKDYYRRRSNDGQDRRRDQTEYYGGGRNRGSGDQRVFWFHKNDNYRGDNKDGYKPWLRGGRGRGRFRGGYRPWVPRGRGRGRGRGWIDYNKQDSYSNRGDESQGWSDDHYRHEDVKSKWEKEEDQGEEEEGGKGEDGSSAPKSQETLNELEEFYHKLKTDKKRKSTDVPEEKKEAA